MLSSSPSKIHEPPVTGVSRRPPDRRPAAAKLRNTRDECLLYVFKPAPRAREPDYGRTARDPQPGGLTASAWGLTYGPPATCR